MIFILYSNLILLPGFVIFILYSNLILLPGFMIFILYSNLILLPGFVIYSYLVRPSDIYSYLDLRSGFGIFMKRQIQEKILFLKFSFIYNNEQQTSVSLDYRENKIANN